MSEADLSLAELLPILERLAHQALPLWEVPEGCDVTLINVSENVTYLVEAPDFKAVLRVHRSGYNSSHAIQSELDWLTALGSESPVATPKVIRGRNGKRIQSAVTDGLDAPRYMVLFHFIEGIAPDEQNDLTPGFEELGQIAARCHEHVLSWDRPEGFDRMTWDETSVFGHSATWGNWRDAPGVTDDIRIILEDLENTIVQRLGHFGKSAERFNLIHADMRLANLIIAPSGTRLIDFDDCGWGWFLYDFAAAISFIEDDPRIPELKDAWVRGYKSVRPLAPDEEAEIDTFVVLRRLALLAWIGSHIEAPEPQALAHDFAANTAVLAERYLKGQAHT